MSYRLKMVLPLVGLLLLCGYAAFAVIRASKVQEIRQPLPHDAPGIVGSKSAGGD